MPEKLTCNNFAGSVPEKSAVGLFHSYEYFTYYFGYRERKFLPDRQTVKSVHSLSDPPLFVLLLVDREDRWEDKR